MVEVGKANIRIPVKIMRCAPGSFRYKTLSVQKGIKALFCCPARKYRYSKSYRSKGGRRHLGRCEEGMKMVTVLYDTRKWNLAEAKAHAKKRFMKLSRSRSRSIMY